VQIELNELLVWWVLEHGCRTFGKLLNMLGGGEEITL